MSIKKVRKDEYGDSYTVCYDPLNINRGYGSKYRTHISNCWKCEWNKNRNNPSATEIDCCYKKEGGEKDEGKKEV